MKPLYNSNGSRKDEFENELLQIAKVHFHVDTLKPRNSDRLDFKEVSVWAMSNALEAAYWLGRNSK